MDDVGADSFESLPRHARIKPRFTVRHPLAPAAICLIVGVLSHEIMPIRPAAWAATAGSLAVVGALVRRPLIGSICLAIAFVAVGLAAAQAAHYRYAADDVGHFATEEPRLAELEVELVETPRLIRPPEMNRPRPPKLAGVAEVRRVRTWDGWQDASGSVLFQLREPRDDLKAGQTVRVLGRLQRPGPAANPGQFDFANYYRLKRVVASVNVGSAAHLTVVAARPPPAITRLREGARSLLSRGFDDADDEPAAILKMMLLGERDEAMSDARELFRQSGTSHYLAVSGLHVGVVGGAIFGLVRLLGAGPRGATAAGVGAVLLYATAAAPAPPVLRAAVVAGAMGVGLLAGRRGAGVQLLSAAAVALLLLSPLDLYRAGFQLSFVTVLGLVLFGTALQRRMAGSARAPEPANAAVRAGRWLDGRAAASLSAAIVAWLAAMPLVAQHFGQFNSWAVPASIAAGPWAVASLIGGLLKIGLTLIVPPLDWLWADLALLPVRAMRGTVAFFAAMPGADVPLPTPPVWAILAFYGSIALAWLAWPREGRAFPAGGAAWAARAPLAASAVVVFVLPLAGTRVPGTTGGPLTVTLLAVGAGQCAAVETPGGGVTLLDAGSTSLATPLESCVAPFLRHRGHARVDRVVVSHANVDHYNAVADVAEKYGAVDVVVNPTFAADAVEQPTGRQLLDALDAADRPPRVASAGDVIPLGRDTTLTVLWPPANRPDLQGNDGSLVLRLEHAGRRVLFSGDVESDGMGGLLALADDDPDLLRADVLIAPHHGSSEDETAAFVEAVAPQYVLSSDGRRLSGKQRRLPDLLGGRPLLRTGSAGAVTIVVDAAGDLSVESFLSQGRRTLTYPE